MSNINECNNDEGMNWIDDAIKRKYIKHYEYENFKNIQEVSSGTFGKVFRAKWKNFEDYLVLKSFFAINDITIKEIVREIQFRREVDYHNNIIRFYGISTFGSEIFLVMEYAENGSLRDYLKENFNRLTWSDKYNLAHQLARSVLYLHDEGLVHGDLHSCNVLIHQNSVKLADFGLSRRIDEASKSQSKLLGMVPYIDPQPIMNNTIFNQKSDVYSIGVLLWEISSGIPPFDGENSLGLIFKISQGQRERAAPDTPNGYIKLYTECWDGESDNRPSIHEVVRRLEMFASTPSNEQIIIEIMDLIHKVILKGDEWDQITHHVKGYFNNNNINPKEIYNWLLNNQNNVDAVFLLGFFNYCKIGVEHYRCKKAFKLFSNAAKRDHTLSQYFIGECYEHGYGVKKNPELSLKYYNKINEKGSEISYFKLGWYHDDVKKDLETAAYWYEKAADNGNYVAMYNLGTLYEVGDGIEEDRQKAFELFEESAKNKYTIGINSLAECYYHGSGTEVNIEKSFELYKESAELGDRDAQKMVAEMYQKGDGVEKDLNQANYWQGEYEKNKDE